MRIAMKALSVSAVLAVAAGQQYPSVAPPYVSSTMFRPWLMELPTASFPGPTKALSHAAWPSGNQPRTLEYWPKANTGELYPCWKTTVLRDMNEGWPGKCLYLHETSLVDDSLSNCAGSCAQNPECAVWQQWHKCYQGLGYSCYERHGDTDFVPSGAQRLQHGDIRILMDISGWQISGLKKVDRGLEADFNNRTLALQNCREICYANIRCQYWQYESHGGDEGCWVEDPSSGKAVEYPLRSGHSAWKDSKEAKKIVAGEFIQHLCPDMPEGLITSTHSFFAPFPAVTAGPKMRKAVDEEKTWNKMPWALGIGGLLMAGLMAVAAIWAFRPSKKKRSTRALQIPTEPEIPRLEEPLAPIPMIQTMMPVQTMPSLSGMMPVQTVPSMVPMYQQPMMMQQMAPGSFMGQQPGYPMAQQWR